MASLIVSSPRYNGTEFAIPDQGVLTIGRDFTTNIPLESRMVSRTHAEVRSVGQSFVFKDLGSKLGTLVNGARAESKILQDGDVLTIGLAQITFVMSMAMAPTLVMEPQQSAPTPPAPAPPPGMRCHSCGAGIPFSDIASGAAGRTGANFYCEKCLRESNTISMIDIWNQ